MDFLIKLTNVIYDEHLPVVDRDIIDAEFRNNLDTFMGNQAMICAPVFLTGRFKQEAPLLRCLPFVEAHLHHQRASGDVFKVKFHREHLKLKTDPEGDYTGDVSFRMKVFEELLAAARHASWDRKVLGFMCEGKYYMCYWPHAWSHW